VRILRTANNWLGVAKRSTQSCELFADARRKNLRSREEAD
jgi:hypothetical protein